MAKRIIDDALRGMRFGRSPDSRQINRVMDKVLTEKPRMSGRKQSLTEMEIRDEIARRTGNRIKWPRF